MTVVQKKWLAAAVAFLAAWQATNFDLDYRSVLGAVVAVQVMLPLRANSRIPLESP